MEEDLETLTTTSSSSSAAATTTTTQESNMYQDDIDSCCSTPYVSAPSSPGRNNQPPPPPPPPCSGGYYYSAPSSPMHFVLSKTTLTSSISSLKQNTSSSSSFEFDFSARFTTNGSNSPEKSMSSADELFLNGQIRPMKLSTHLKRPQMLTPLLDCDDENDDQDSRGRENMKLRDKSVRRRTRSMSPLRTSSSYVWQDDENVEKNEEAQNPDIKEEEEEEEVARGFEASLRSSSARRSSKRWVFLKEFLYRSKSEGRNSKKMEKLEKMEIPKMKLFNGGMKEQKKRMMNGKSVNGNGGVSMAGKRRVPLSAHELHYTANRAQAEEMRKKTFLPYRQGLLGCLGFNSKSYGAWNGFTRALNPVSSR